MENVVVTKELCKKFKGHLAVDHVNMTIRKGEIYGLIGKNGAGKTTFMRMICGLAEPTEGNITLFESSNLEQQRHKMGCIIENPALYPAMTAEENMKVYQTLIGIKDDNIIQDLLEFVGLNNVESKKTKNFSLGMKQRLMIAIALMGNPELLILDEPMNGLDPTGIKEVRELLVQLNAEKHITILISSHILEELSKITTHYGVINDGKLIDEFTAEELEERCRKNLKITVDDIKKAEDIIRKNITENFEIESKKDIILYDNLEKAGEINKLLLKENITVTSIVPGEQELEDYYMSLIGGKK